MTIFNTIRIYSDASVRGDRTGLGYCLKAWKDGKVVTLSSGQKRIERRIKTVQAEYQGLLYAIEEAEKYDADTATLHTDCKSVAKAIRTRYHGDAHAEYVGRIVSAMEQYDNWRALWTPRGDNRTAHKQSRLASSSECISTADS